MAYKYYVQERPLKGPRCEFHVDPVTKKPFKKEGAFEFASSRHGQFPDCRHVVYDGNDVQVGDDFPATLTPGSPGTVSTVENSPPPARQRPAAYRVTITGVPAAMRSHYLCNGRLPHGCDAETGVNGTHEFQNWDAAYYVCTDLVKALRAAGWKTRGNYRVAVWNCVKSATGKSPQVARIFFDTHFEKLTRVVGVEAEPPPALPVPDDDEEWQAIDRAAIAGGVS